MEIKTLTAAISELGFPIIAALFLGIVLYKLGGYLLKLINNLLLGQQKDRLKAVQAIREDVTQAIADLRAAQTEELNEIQLALNELKTITIRLTDRIRTLTEEIYQHDSAARAVWGLAPQRERQQTRAERREALQDQLSDINPTNGNHF